MADRPRFSSDQLTQFFDRIGLSRQKRIYSVGGRTDDDKLKYLYLLKKHTLVRIPFENLTLHYSWHRTINVRPQHLFNKIVSPPSRRGGYCMEANSLFHTVLLSLGYQAFMAGARVCSKDTGKYGGFSHCVNIVIIGNERWMLDVGFGANGPTMPMHLSHEFYASHVRASQAKTRVVHEPIPQNVDQSQKIWIYQFQIGPGEEWVPQYCFVDTEFLLEDIRCMNLSPWKSPSSWFTQKVVLTRFTTHLEREKADDLSDGPGSASEGVISRGDIDGALILFHDSLKWRRFGRTKLEIKFSSDAERIDAIRKYFGIELDEEDREAIRGTVGEIRSVPNLFD
ncbi:cysteine proteinase [Hypoxylon trugodes]|uniref:cysteine proteinase n=1 Tax=Hypoxylon trugodes TaxID=326681 RepID=UPI0021946938|nr:cysteine proteinase [Hypoxylon trugodes]KAI1385963.1 cysteine proteinase [Hypoxylon trugodes]